MNVDYECAWLIEEFCHGTGRLSVRGNSVLDWDSDFRPFLDWIAADPKRSETWRFLRSSLGMDDRGVFLNGLAEPRFGRWVSA